MEMKLVQFKVSRYFSGVIFRAPSGMRRAETVCRTPLDAYMSDCTSSASDIETFSDVVTTLSCLPLRVVTALG